MKVVFFSRDGIEEFQVLAEARRGTSLEKLKQMMGPVEALIATLPAHEMDAFTTSIGQAAGSHGHFMANTGSHLAGVSVFLTPFQNRDRTATDIVQSLKGALEEIRGREPFFEKLTIEIAQGGPPGGKPVQVGVRGEDFKVVNQIASEILEELKRTPGVSDAVTTFDFGKRQILVNVDEAAARKASLTVGQVAQSVRAAFRGAVATTIKPSKAEKEIDVLVRFPEDVRGDRAAFEKILVQNTQGDLVPLQAVARIEEAEGINSIGHYNGKRVVYVTAEVDDKQATSLGVNSMLAKTFQDVPKRYPGYSLYFGGEHQKNMESMMSLGVAAIFALLMIFIILAASFGSLVQPFIIMVAIPFGFMGVILAFFLHGLPLSFFAFIGMIGLAGVVVNQSIVLLDFINELRRQGVSRRESIITAGRLRLRPIFMTSMTTIAGLVSIAYNFGGGDPFIRPMALAMLWGLAVSTMLSLLVTPCIYAILDDLAERIVHHPTVRPPESGAAASI
ncbi:MAG: efflux RND transporter permease subunit [Elusimicrobia bacterium]|nr:efflux RND transporter permease subunit [Elusimicrobiota bacterium]